MSNIDFSQIICAEAKAEKAAEGVYEAAKLECRNRILMVLDETAQLNLTAAAAAGVLSAEELNVYRAGLQWIAGMREAWLGVAENGARGWPEAPSGLKELAAAF